METWIEAEIGRDTAFVRTLENLQRAWIRPSDTVGEWASTFRSGELAVGLVQVGARLLHTYLNQLTRRRLRGSNPTPEISAASIVEASLSFSKTRG